MKKFRLFLFLLIGFFLAMNFALAKSDFELKQDWNKKEVSFKKFKEIFINNIDLRGLTVELIDDEDDAVESDISEGVLTGIGYEVNRIFKRRLRKILPVKEVKEIESQNGLIIDVKLSATFRVQDRGFIMSKLVGPYQEDRAELFIECSLFDSSDGSKILELKDSEEILSTNPLMPFTTDRDLKELSSVLDIWASRLALFVYKQRKLN